MTFQACITSSQLLKVMRVGWVASLTLKETSLWASVNFLA